MKKKSKLLIFPFLLLAVLLGACGDEEEGRISINDSAPSQVTNVTAASVAGGVTLTWNIPQDASFMYTKVAYTNAKGEESYQMFSKERADAAGKMTATISGFVKTQPVKFQLIACSVRGNNQGAVEVEGTPGEPNFVKVLDKITVDPGLGGIVVNYNNEYDETIIVGVDYQAAGDASKSGAFKFEVPAKAQGKQFVRLTYGDNQFIAGEECKINIHTEDAYDNASESRTFSVTPQETVLLDRSSWTFPGFDFNSSEGTIGYSSQESSGEGATNGRVTCMLDGDTGSFWHSRWKGVNMPYPHWFIIDMAAEHTIASIEITGRLNNNRMETGHQILVCTEADAAGIANPANWNWQDMGEYPFVPGNNSPQTIDLTDKLPKARYIKVYIGEKFKGSSDNAMISEFNVYAVE